MYLKTSSLTILEILGAAMALPEPEPLKAVVPVAHLQQVQP